MSTASSEVPPAPSANNEDTSPEVKRYQRQKITVKLIGLAVNLLILVVLALAAGRYLPPLLQHWVGDNSVFQLIVVAVIVGVAMELPTLPLDFYSGYILEHRYQLSNQTLAKWIVKRIKGYLVGGAIGLPLLLGLYAILWLTGQWWWVWATVGALLVTLVLGRIMPVLILPLFYKVTRLDAPELQSRLEKIAEGTGLTLEGVYQLHLSDETKKANAALTGLGKTRRVLLGDTLLDQFSPEEIEVVFAHEVGHHVHKHLPKMIVWSVFTTAAGFWLVDVILRNAAPGLGYPSFDHPSALPLLMLVLSLFALILSPVQNVLSRFFERQCDSYALKRTGLNDAYRSAFTKLAKINKSDPNPNSVVVWLFYDHPPIKERLAMAEISN